MNATIDEGRVAAREPGSEGLWTFVFIDMTIFLLIFLTYMGDRLGKAAVYGASQAKLSETFGLANTLILVTSSWMVAEAVAAARRETAARVSRYLAIALVLGIVFVADKILEYTLEIRAGISPATNAFFSYYFFITFAHLMHVIVGVGFIAYFRSLAPSRTGQSRFLTQLENIGLFWHFVDVIWLFIFPLLYLVGRP